MERLLAGALVAVVSDAGTPGVSDPGVELVQACLAEGVPVDPVPGASAPLAAAVGSGFPMVPLSLFGFAPARSNDRKRWLSALSEVHHTCVFFEAPTRIESMLSDAGSIMGERPIVVARELTKIHQEFIPGTAISLSSRFQHARGEFTVVLGPWTPPPVAALPATDEEMADEFWRVTKTVPSSRRQALGMVAKRFGRPQREVYAAVERRKYSGQ
jgi:16S rRNA (cytidine1402-2'-O)-methyltransferase